MLARCWFRRSDEARHRRRSLRYHKATAERLQASTTSSPLEGHYRSTPSRECISRAEADFSSLDGHRLASPPLALD